MSWRWQQQPGAHGLDDVRLELEQGLGNGRMCHCWGIRMDEGLPHVVVWFAAVGS